MKSSSFLLIPLLIFSAFLFYNNCSGNDDNQDSYDDFSIKINPAKVSSITTEAKLHIKSSRQWSISTKNKDKTWVSFSSDQGIFNSDVTVNLAVNSLPEDRSVVISVSNGLKTIKVKLIQEGDPGPELGELGWVELPQEKVMANTVFITHKLPDNPLIRNYSLLYDTKEKIAYWVAYPMHSSYLGSSGRTDAWDYDPQIPQEEQATLFSGISGYDRGHQIASADRTSSKNNNRSTFYFSNMTPQNKVLNQNLWANLENKVRTWTYQCDTLYVVTGAMIKTSKDKSIKYVYDNNSNKIAVPKYYFKALLKRKKNNFTSIAYKIDNSTPQTSTNYNLYKLNVSQLEKETGFVFFPKISEKIKSSIDDSQWK